MPKLLHLPLLCALACGAVAAEAPAERPQDLRAFLAGELAAGKKRVVIPPGRYPVQAENGSHLVLTDLSGIEIVAEGVELVCTSTVRALRIERCSDVTIRGLAIDYDPLPFTQGTITAIAPDKSWLEFVAAEGYPVNELEERVEIYDPATGILRRDDARWEQEIESLGERRFRFRKAARYRFDPLRDTERVGDILVTNNRHGKPGSPHAVELRWCRGMVLEEITVFASPCFGFLEHDCHGSRYLRCVIDRRAPEDDPVKRAQPRMRSLNADAFHSKDASRGPAIIGCTARYQGDDCVNINGRYHYVSRSKGREVRIAVLDRKPKIRAGDPVEFLPWSGPRPPDAVTVEVRPDPEPISEEEKAFISRLRIDERIRTGLLEGKATFHTLVLDREVALPPGSAVCCPRRIGNGFAVKDCDFGPNRSRGILIKASNGEVSGNKVSGSRMHAVLVCPEFWWMEAGISSDLVIRDNVITGCLEAPVTIRALGGNRQPLPAGAHRNISILDNRFEDCAWPLVHVTSTSGLKIDGNRFPAAPAGPDGKPVDAILLEHCEPAR